MELLLKALVLAIALILIAGVVFVVSQRGAPATFTSSQAVQLVKTDLKANNPGANITVINVSNSIIKQDSWNIIVSVSYNSTRPCPTLLVESFDYPATGLRGSIDNIYTQGCKIYGLAEAPSYVINSPEIVIARSYNINNTWIRNYVNRFGYNNVDVHAMFLVANSSSNSSSGLSNVWRVVYDSQNANYSVYAILNPSGAILQTYNISKHLNP